MVLFPTVFLFGVGQIGASLGLALRRNKLAREVVGVGRGRANLNEAKRRGAITSFRVGAGRLPPDIASADLIVLAAPVATIRWTLERLPRGPLIIDVGSTKEAIVRVAERRGLRFIGCHPIAGSERSGSAAADPDLFRNRVCLLTAVRGASRRECRKDLQRDHQRDLKKIERLWRQIGSRVIPLSPERHDRLLGAVSHLPHAAAFSLMSVVSRMVDRGTAARLSLGGLKDMTRVAASPPSMWVDIFLENRRWLLGLRRYRNELARLERMVRSGARRRLFSWLAAAQRVRRSLDG